MTHSPPAISPEFFNQYVGIPFSWNGYTRDGVSCWGLVVLVYKELYGIALDRHDELIEIVAGGDEEDWSKWRNRVDYESVPLGEEVCGDILHMSGLQGNRVTNLHVGVVVSPGKVIHSQSGVGVVISDYHQDQRYKNRIIGAYRVR